VLAFFAGAGLRHAYRVPLLLVDLGALSDYGAREGRPGAGGGGGPVFHVRGLMLAEVYRAIPSLVRSPAGRGGAGGGVVASPADALRVASSSVARCDVTAILVLHGLPRLLTGAILAHELTHALLRMRGVHGLAPEVEEGVCQLLALLWLDAQAAWVAAQPRADYQARLQSYFAYQIRNDPSAVYGDGFRAAHEAFQDRGLAALLEHVTRTGRFPPPLPGGGGGVPAAARR